jgi:predicted DNA-binding protein
MAKRGKDVDPEEKMMSYTFRLPKDLLDQLKGRAGSIPISVVIRRLIEKYIKGEVGID